MATTASNRAQRPRQSAPTTAQLEESAHEITTDLVDYLTNYARQKPGYAALCCIGVGFVLGWKLKPW